MKTALVYLNNDKLVSRGVGYLAQVVKGAGHDLDFYDTAWTPDDEVVRRVAEGGYEVLLVSTTSLYWPRAKRMIEALRDRREVIYIVVGGYHATIVGSEILDECPAVDYLCIGEGEGFVAEFLGRLEEGSSVTDLPNIGYRGPAGAKVNGVRPATDLHSLPQFDFTVWNPGSVVREEMIEGFTYCFATRGCPYSCSYCCNSYMLDLYGKSLLRTQRVDVVVAELQDLKANYPAKLLYFGDEMILFDVDYCEELFTRVHDEVRMPYGCMTRVETITPRVVQLLKDTGCVYVGMGIECGDEAFRREWLDRRMTNEQIVRAFRSLKESIPGIFLTSYNMKGFPVANDAELTRKTVALNREAGVDHVQMTWFFPLRGTKLGDYCRERGLVDEEKVAAVNDYFAQSVLRWDKIKLAM